MTGGGSPVYINATLPCPVRLESQYKVILAISKLASITPGLLVQVVIVLG